MYPNFVLSQKITRKEVQLHSYHLVLTLCLLVIKLACQFACLSKPYLLSIRSIWLIKIKCNSPWQSTINIKNKFTLALIFIALRQPLFIR